MSTKSALHMTRSNTMRHPALSIMVFPLLCPVREYDWIPHWNCKLIHSQSGFAELDCVFTTTFLDFGPQTWTCSRYEPSQRIEYIITGQHTVTRLAIVLQDTAHGESQSIWTRTYTGLDAIGNDMVDAITEEHYAAEAERLESMLNHYLQTGTSLPKG